ncbi:MAG TPA: DciA family protein [Devosia sp.]|nr:DciA family protein [Devosia sp.]
MPSRARDRQQGEKPPQRRNRAVAVGDALSGVLDSVLRKRGFATRDLLTHWAAMAPRPYDRLAIPDQLKWPRGAGHDGATLYLRCAPGHALALAHEAPLIAAAVNRYFGYLLVREVRLSAAPFESPPPAVRSSGPPEPEALRAAAEAVGGVADPELKDALAALGRAVLRRKGR